MLLSRAKEKSLKLRTVITALALYKYSDKKHRLTPQKLNPFLKPHGLRISGVGLSDDIRVLRELGVDAHTNEGTQAHSAYIGEHIFSDDTLRKLIFAVSTNPYINQDQATTVLNQLAPLVTVYQEPFLRSFFRSEGESIVDDALYWNYLVVREAMRDDRRILYSIDYPKYDVATRTVGMRREWETLFTPLCLIKCAGKLYVQGYNDTDKKADCLELSKLASVRLSQEYNVQRSVVRQKKESIRLYEMPDESEPKIVYTGPAKFRCFASNLGALLEMFGEPSGPVEQTYNYRTTYQVDKAVVSTRTLSRLAALSAGGGLQIVGPAPLKGAVEAYYAEQRDVLVSKRFPRKRQ